MSEKPIKIEISHRTIVFTIIAILSVWLVYLIRDIIAQLFVALLIMAIMNPTVTRLSRYKVPRVFSIIIVYFAALSVVGFTIASLVPTLVDQTTSFVNGLPKYVERAGVFGIYSDEVISQLITQIGRLPSQVAKFTVSAFSNALDVLTVMIFAFYLLLSRNKFDDKSTAFFGKERSKQISETLVILERRLGSWARGQLALMLLIWLSTYVGLLLLGIPYALPLATLAGMLEIVPYMGPVLAAIPVVIIGFGISPVIGFATLALAFLIQQLENYVFVPKVMERTAGVHPVVVLIALSVGFKLAGVVGVLVSIPITITIQVMLKKAFILK